MDEFLGFADIYVLSEYRSQKLIDEFLEEFVPRRKESSDEYYVPYLADNPNQIFYSYSDLIAHCILHPKETNAIYFSNEKNEDPQSAMIFFTDDGKTILGLSIEKEQYEVHFLDRLKDFCRSKNGYITYEDIPPLNSNDFLKKIKELSDNNMV